MYKTSQNLILGRSHFYFHMPLPSVQLIFVHMREYLHLPILRPLKYVSRAPIKVKAFPPLTFCNVPWSQNLNGTLKYSCCSKVRFYRYFVCPEQKHSSCSPTYYLLFWCSWLVSEVDRVATQRAWVAEAGCQQAYDRSKDGDLWQGNALCVCVCVWEKKVQCNLCFQQNAYRRAGFCFILTNTFLHHTQVMQVIV